MSETEKLVPKTDKQQEEKGIKGIVSCRAFIIITVIMFLFVFRSVFSYVINEWTQQKCILEYFTNVSSAKTNHSCTEVNDSSTDKDKHDHVQQDTSVWNLYYKLANYLPKLLSTVLLLSLTDEYGRRFLVILSLTSTFLNVSVSTVVIYVNGSPWYIVGASFLEGIGGGMSGFHLAVFAMAADITTLDQRVFVIVVIELAGYVGESVAPFLAGFLVETVSIGFFNTSLICSVVLFLCVLAVVFVFRETLSVGNRKKLSSMEVLIRPFKFYTSNEFKGQRLGYILLLLTFSLYCLVLSGRSDLETVYLLGKPFCWGPAKLGYYITVRNAAGCFIGISTMKLLMKCFSNEAITLMSILSTMASYVIEGFANSTLTLYMVTVVGLLYHLPFPLIRGIMSSVTSPDMQGSIFASAGFVETIGGLIGTMISRTLYAQTVYIWPGLVFEGMAVLSIINATTMSLYICVKTKKKDSTMNVNENC